MEFNDETIAITIVCILSICTIQIFFVFVFKSFAIYLFVFMRSTVRNEQVCYFLLFILFIAIVVSYIFAQSNCEWVIASNDKMIVATSNCINNKSFQFWFQSHTKVQSIYVIAVRRAHTIVYRIHMASKKCHCCTMYIGITFFTCKRLQ